MQDNYQDCVIVPRPKVTPAAQLVWEPRPSSGDVQFRADLIIGTVNVHAYHPLNPGSAPLHANQTYELCIQYADNPRPEEVTIDLKQGASYIWTSIPLRTIPYNNTEPTAVPIGEKGNYEVWLFIPVGSDNRRAILLTFSR